MTLQETLAEAWRLLAQAVNEPQAPFRTLALATVAADGTPDQRIVILRHVSAEARQVQVHTDIRSAKFAQMQQNPAVTLLAWDPVLRLQLRLTGVASLHTGDAVAIAAWDSLSPLGRQLYRAKQTPGSVVPGPDAIHTGEVAEADAFANFAAIDVVIARLESLRLAGHGQIRARFDWADGALSQAWLVP